MPSVATAPTATAAQTSAAGSRMLGYYLGGGGVKVDCLFDTANFLTKDGAGPFRFAGNFGIGIAPSYRLHVQSSGEIARFETTTARGLGGGFIGIADPSGRKGYWGYGGAADHMYIHNGMNGGVFIGTNNQSRWYVDNVGLLYPVTDNVYSVGAAGNRPSVIYAATGAINTSDAREKTWRGAPSFAELAAARRIAGELGFYQWNDAIAEKGEDGARYHFGVRAQAVWAIMADEGLIDPIVEGEPPTCSYAFLCYDEWPAIEAVEEERDEEGNITVAAVEARPAGNRFGIRPDQLTLFLIAAQEARLAALEAA